MTKTEYESMMFELQIEYQKVSNEKQKAETKLIELDVQLKQAHLTDFLNSLSGSK